MAAKKRIGRPPKSEEDRKAVNFTFRSRGQMRDRLQAAAAASRRSISEEIEYRLENSFREDDRYGGPHLSAVFRLLADHKALLRRRRERSGQKVTGFGTESRKSSPNCSLKNCLGFTP